MDPRATSARDASTRAASGLAASLLQYGLQIALQAILMPVVLRRAGQEALGVYAVVLQIVGYLALTDLGFGAATSRSLAQAHAGSGAVGSASRR